MYRNHMMKEDALILSRYNPHPGRALRRILSRLLGEGGGD